MKKQKWTVVFDLDGSLETPYFKKEDSRKVRAWMEKHPCGYSFDRLYAEVMDGLPHFLLNGALELLRWVHDQGFEIVFFSNAVEERNRELCPIIMERAFGKGKEPAYRVLSRGDFVDTTRMKDKQGNALQGLWHGNYKKKLAGIVVPTRSLPNTLMIEDDDLRPFGADHHPHVPRDHWARLREPHGSAAQRVLPVDAGQVRARRGNARHLPAVHHRHPRLPGGVGDPRAGHEDFDLMAEGGEKTEMPTPKKLRDARQKGQVCTSKDIVSTALLVVLMYLTAALSMTLADDMEELIIYIGGTYSMKPEDAVRLAGMKAVWDVMKHSFIFVLVAAFTGVAANLCQIGFLFTLDPIIPKGSKLNPAEGFKRIFAMKNLFEFFKNCLKVTFLGYLIYKLIASSYQELLTLGYGTVDDMMPILKVIMKRLAAYTAFGYVVIAALDRFFQQKNFTKEMMMTKDEVKREYKEMEGSQEIKQAQRQFRDEIPNGPDPVKATKQADVVVMNPTHLAEVLKWVKRLNDAKKEEAELDSVEL